MQREDQSNLNKLIQELCPKGVEYRTLGEVAHIERGGNFQKKDFVDDGVPCIHYGQIYTRYGVSAKKAFSFLSDDIAKRQKFAKPNDIIMAVTSENLEDVCKCLVWEGNENVAVSGHTAIIRTNLSGKYLAYYFQTEDFFLQKKRLAHGTKVIEVAPSSLLNVSIPVPPLPVQAEIVRILDTFTALTAELTAELTARRKQYEYYRDRLLTFDDLTGGVRWVTIEEVCERVSSGGTPNTKNKAYYGGEIPWLRTQEVEFREISQTGMCITEEGLNNSSAKWIPANSVVVAMYGATVGKVGYTSIPLTTNQACCNLEINSTIASYKYVYYCLANQYEYIKSLGQGSQTNINAQIIKNLKIPLPPLSEQRRIVSILDRFDALCNDLTQGLPAEIEARRKQYEFYRDRLLDFQRKE